MCTLPSIDWWHVDSSPDDHEGWKNRIGIDRLRLSVDIRDRLWLLRSAYVDDVDEYSQSNNRVHWNTRVHRARTIQ